MGDGEEGEEKKKRVEIDAEEAINALNLMLGSEEKAMHAAKLY